MSGLKKLKILLIALNLFIFLKPNFYLNELSGKTPLLDFDAYRLLVERAKNGLNPYLSGGMITLGPPPVLFYFLPFSFIGIEAGRSLSTLLNITCGFLLCYLLAKNYYPKRLTIVFPILSAVLFSSFPVRFSVGMGQPGLLISLLIGIVIIKSKENLKSYSLAALLIVKSFFLVSLLPFLLKNRKILIKTLITLAVIILLGFPFLKPEWYSYYFAKEFPGIFSNRSSPTGLDYYNQSLRSTLFRLGMGSVYEVLFLPLLISTGAFIILTSNFGLSVISAILLSPVSWQHYYVAFFPIFVMLFAGSKKSLKNIFLISFAFLLWWIEFPWLQGAKVNLVNGILASHYFISGLILSFLLLKRPTTLKNRI